MTEKCKLCENSVKKYLYLANQTKHGRPQVYCLCENCVSLFPDTTYDHTSKGSKIRCGVCAKKTNEYHRIQIKTKSNKIKYICICESCISLVRDTKNTHKWTQEDF